MSTYGTSAVLDSPAKAVLNALAKELAADPGADVYWSTAPDGWWRTTVAWEGIEKRARVAELLGRLPEGRAAIAEDHDEFGAEWTVLAVENGEVTVLHRRYVLNADPTDAADVADAISSHDGRDPRAGDVTGETAATAAAVAFGSEAGPMLAAEAAAASSELITGAVGDAFPWWPALGIPWPGEAAGKPVEPPASRTVTGLGAAAWPRFARDHVRPRLAAPERWAITRFGLVRDPTTWLLRSMTRDGPGRWIQLLAHVQPLYLPYGGHLVLTWSTRLRNPRGGWGYDLSEPVETHVLGAEIADGIVSQGEAYLDEVGHLAGYAEDLSRKQAKVLDERGVGGVYAEELGYTLLLLGDHDRAAEELASVGPPAADASECQLAQAARMASMSRLVQRDPQAAVAQLDAWARETAQAIGVERTDP
jgi:hypothetical protein